MEPLNVDWSSEVPDPTLIDFIKGFQENRKKEIVPLKKLLEIQDFDGLRKLGHNWKGFGRPYGYLALERLGVALEKAALAQDLGECQELFKQFLEYINEKDIRLQNQTPS